MKKLYTTAFAVTLTALGISAQAQTSLFVDTGYTAQQMVTDFFGTSACVAISNITYTGTPQSMGFFDAGSSNLGLNAGLLITSGSIFYAAGPNDQPGASAWSSGVGDAALDLLTTGPTMDASVVEFDIVASSDTLCFRYVFGSEEYNEFVGSGVNDVFGFFVSGPGYGTDSNVALIPGSQASVTINNVNCGSNSAYYVCNDPFNPTTGSCDTSVCPSWASLTTVGYDGFTTPLCAKLVVTPGATYHIKMGVADVGDQILDSGVFVDIESLCGGAALACVADFQPGFGTDPSLVAFENASLYGSSWTWFFGDGNTSIEKNPVHEYGADGTYNVMLVTCNSMTCDTTFQTIAIGETGVDGLELSDIVVFPNPATNTLSVKSISGNTGTVSLYDAAGRLIVQQDLNGNGLVDVSSFTSGVYMVELLSHQGVHRTRFVKQ